MKNILFTILISCLSISAAQSVEVITVNSYTSAGSSVNNFYRRIFDQANQDQDQYQFVLVPKPGAQGFMAINDMDQTPENKLVIISAGFVDLYLTDKIKKDDYIPINSAGNSCWVVITNRGNTKHGANSLKGQKEIFVGTIAKGSSAHFTALVLGEKLGFQSTAVMFKSNVEALVLMAGDGSINMVVESPANYLNWRDRKTDLQGIGINCPVRNPKLPEMQTMHEQGFDVPSIWAFTVANRAMPEDKRKNITRILDRSMRQLGQDQIFQQFDYQLPISHGQTTEQHYRQSLEQNERLRKKFANELR